MFHRWSHISLKWPRLGVNTFSCFLFLFFLAVLFNSKQTNYSFSVSCVIASWKTAPYSLDCSFLTVVKVNNVCRNRDKQSTRYITERITVNQHSVNQTNYRPSNVEAEQSSVCSLYHMHIRIHYVCLCWTLYLELQ